MAAVVKLELPIRGFAELSRYLVAHEQDIANDFDDFAELRAVYVEIFEEEPSCE